MVSALSKFKLPYYHKQWILGEKTEDVPKFSTINCHLKETSISQVLFQETPLVLLCIQRMINEQQGRGQEHLEAKQEKTQEPVTVLSTFYFRNVLVLVESKCLEVKKTPQPTKIQGTQQILYKQFSNELENIPDLHCHHPSPGYNHLFLVLSSIENLF